MLMPFRSYCILISPGEPDSYEENQALINYLDEYIDGMSYDAESEQVTTSGRFRHYCASSSFLIICFVLAFAASFWLPKGLLNFVIKSKAIFLSLSCAFTIGAEYFVQVFNSSSYDDMLDKFKDTLLGGSEGEKHEEIVYVEVSLLGNALPWILRYVSICAEAIFTGFDQNTTLVFCKEIFLCTCRTEIYSFSLPRCVAKMAVASSVSLVKGVLARTTHRLLANKMKLVPALSAIMFRFYDTIFSFILTVVIVYWGIKIILGTLKSIRFHRANGSSIQPPSAFAHPIMRIIVIEMSMQCAKFAYYLGVLVGFIPDHEADQKEKDCVKSFTSCDHYERLWSTKTDHLTMLHILSLVEISFLFMSRVKVPSGVNCKCGSKKVETEAAVVVEA